MPPATQIEIRLAEREDAAAISVVLHESFAEFKELYTGPPLRGWTSSSREWMRDRFGLQCAREQCWAQWLPS